MNQIIGEETVILPNVGKAQDFISELHTYLDSRYKLFDTHSMNEGGLFLQGQKDMLGQIIKLLSNEIV